MMSFLSGHSSDGKLVSLLNDHHVSPTSSSPPSSSAANGPSKKYPAPSASTQAYIAPEMPRLPIPEPSSSQSSSQEATPTPQSSQPANAGVAAREAGKPKKKHVCPTCSRPFSTSGHLSRHQRVHTGERNHKCPFPGCETRCSRQDNLQQHYRIHLSPRSRRSSNANTRSMANSAVRNARRSPPSAAAASNNSSPREGDQPLPVLNSIGVNDQYETAPTYGASLSSYVGGPATLSAAHFGPSSASSSYANGNAYPSTANGGSYSSYPSPHEGSHTLPSSRASSYPSGNTYPPTSSYARGPPSPLSPMHSGPMSSGSSSAGPATPSWPSNSPSHTIVMADGSEHHYPSSNGYSSAQPGAQAYPSSNAYPASSYPSTNGYAQQQYPTTTSSAAQSNAYPASSYPSSRGPSPPPILPPIHGHYSRPGPPAAQSGGSPPPPALGSARDHEEMHKHRVSASASPEGPHHAHHGGGGHPMSRGITPPSVNTSHSYSGQGSYPVQAGGGYGAYGGNQVGLATSDARRKTFA